MKRYEKRYEIRKISNNWYGIYDKVKKDFVIETTSIGIKVYEKMF